MDSKKDTQDNSPEQMDLDEEIRRLDELLDEHEESFPLDVADEDELTAPSRRTKPKKSFFGFLVNVVLWIIVLGGIGIYFAPHFTSHPVAISANKHMNDVVVMPIQKVIQDIMPQSSDSALNDLIAQQEQRAETFDQSSVSGVVEDIVVQDEEKYSPSIPQQTETEMAIELPIPSDEGQNITALNDVYYNEISSLPKEEVNIEEELASLVAEMLVEDMMLVEESNDTDIAVVESLETIPVIDDLIADDPIVSERDISKAQPLKPSLPIVAAEKPQETEEETAVLDEIENGKGEVARKPSPQPQPQKVKTPKVKKTVIDPRVMQAQQAMVSHNYPEALSLYQAVLKDNPADTSALTGERLAQAKIRMSGQKPSPQRVRKQDAMPVQEAGDSNRIQTLKEQAEKEVSHAVPALELAKAYASLGQAEQALKWYREALKRDALKSSGIDRMAIYDAMAAL